MAKKRNTSGMANFWPSFTDGMIGMLLAIVLVFVTVTVQNFLNVQELIRIRQLLGKLDEEVFKPLKAVPGVKAERGTIRVGDNILFDFNSAVLKPVGQTALKPIGVALKRIIDSQGSRIPLQISIEGHTDSVGTTQYNLELSAKRAEALAGFWESAIGLNRYRYDVVTVGRGPFRPLVPQAKTEGQHAQNRRIEIRIYPKFEELVFHLLSLEH